MTNIIIDTDTVDSINNNVITDNYIYSIWYYSPSTEDWYYDDHSSLSWYTENYNPTDNFYGYSLNTDKWSYFNYKSTISGSVSNALKLDIIESECRGGATSENKWRIEGDFDLRLYLDETSYYNEYRAESATGITVSFDESEKFRVSKYYDGSSILYASHYSTSLPLKYYGWRLNGSVSSSYGGEEASCLRLVRSSGNISAYVGNGDSFTAVGPSYSNTSMSGSLFVEIEAETEQLNTYRLDVSGVTISGTVEPLQIFSSSLRGVEQSMPRSLVSVVDNSSLSLLDSSDNSLWMRVLNLSDGMFVNPSADFSFCGGKACYTTSSGLYCIDFINDCCIKYTSGKKYKSLNNIVSRNFTNLFEYIGPDYLLGSDDVTSVDSSIYKTKEYLVATTNSGIAVKIDRGAVKIGPSEYSKYSYIDEVGTLYWNTYDVSSNTGKLKYRDNIDNLEYIIGDEFSETGYFSTTTPIVSLSSENISSMSSLSSSGFRILAIGNEFGIDYIEGLSRRTYGPVNVVNPVSDPYFRNYIGISWYSFSDVSALSNFDSYVSDDWSVKYGNSLKLSLLDSGYVIEGDLGGVYQQVDLTKVDKLYLDYKLVKESSNYLIDLEVSVNNVVVFNVSSENESTHEKRNVSFDVSYFSGLCTLKIYVKSKYSGIASNSDCFYIDNIRVSQIDPDYAVIPSKSHSILEVLLVKDGGYKIYFSCADGYGAIDVSTNTLDFFNEIDDILSLSSIISSEYVEVIDEV